MKNDSKEKPEKKIVATNRRAHAKYEILETCEAGVQLSGPEVKSIRAGNINLQDGFCRIENEIPYLWNVHISPYSMGSLHVHQEPTRVRRLLMNKNEIKKWMGKTTIKGLTVIPLEVYFNKRGFAKVLLALGKGKTGPDRREDIKRRTINREMQKQFAGKQKIK
ncbi:MAG: SsrA-binding protein SmpB [Elusimicrobiota bacterium]